LLGAGGLGPALRVPSAKTGTSNFRRSRRDRPPCTIWRDQGLLMATEGNTTDFKFIEAEILALASRFVVTELAYDRPFAGEIVRNLQDEGLSLVEFGQGFLSMGPASAEFLRLLIGRELQHGGNPIATWCASNVSVRKDPAKERSTEKIDAIVAAVMAVGRMQAGGQGARSVYESIASAAAAFRKESGNTTGAASLRDIGDGWDQFGD
jgi:phage terminase large subunit-like protein